MTDDDLYGGDPYSVPAEPGQKCSCGQQAVRVLLLSDDRRLPICVDKETGRAAVRRMIRDGARYIYGDIGDSGSR